MSGAGEAEETLGSTFCCLPQGKKDAETFLIEADKQFGK